jgi:hypothetical protein
MDFFRKAFLFLVGATAIAIDETNKSIQEAARSVEEQQKRLIQRPMRPMTSEPKAEA